MEDGQPVPGSLFVYAPNKGAPIFFSLAFAASAVGHIWQCYRYNCFKLIGLHSICAVLFTAGYALREYGSFNYLYSTQNLIIYILSQVFIYVCPPLLELANYHILGRILYYVPYLAPLPPGRVLSTFGALIALVETLNALGVSLSANPSSSHSQQELGTRLTIAALAIQLVVIVIFIALAAIFHRRCAKANIHAKAVSTPLITLYMSMLLILIRCIYRLIEHMGNTTVQLDDLQALKNLSPILRYEWFFYIFEAALMLTNSVLWNVRNPGRYLPRNYHVYLAQDGRTEVEGEDQSDDRPLLAKVGSVLTFGFLFRKKIENRPFEELQSFPVSNR
ncbi:putative RTA1 domain protein [Lindgomyces ingoldianus]|uniref:RTA1 domain protein n=1 Tax=Lindgomyces ingoldianus TaxID=673940 RepID=A0ACB6QXZ2_9PLEO|nr:putative RTA1 domain protein [Lindgomyces ingoldianus]KAF2471147.1 putative RTA1 domain protein [Lindgomyces ingoldianus]